MDFFVFPVPFLLDLDSRLLKHSGFDTLFLDHYFVTGNHEWTFSAACQTPPKFAATTTPFTNNQQLFLTMSKRKRTEEIQTNDARNGQDEGKGASVHFNSGEFSLYAKPTVNDPVVLESRNSCQKGTVIELKEKGEVSVQLDNENTVVDTKIKSVTVLSEEAVLPDFPFQIPVIMHLYPERTRLSKKEKKEKKDKSASATEPEKVVSKQKHVNDNNVFILEMEEHVVKTKTWKEALQDVCKAANIGLVDPPEIKLMRFYKTHIFGMLENDHIRKGVPVRFGNRKFNWNDFWQDTQNAQCVTDTYIYDTFANKQFYDLKKAVPGHYVLLLNWVYKLPDHLLQLEKSKKKKKANVSLASSNLGQQDDNPRVKATVRGGLSVVQNILAKCGLQSMSAQGFANISPSREEEIKLLVEKIKGVFEVGPTDRAKGADNYVQRVEFGEFVKDHEFELDAGTSSSNFDQLPSISSAICILRCGKHLLGTGFFISPLHMVTCLHCLYDVTGTSLVLNGPQQEFRSFEERYESDYECCFSGEKPIKFNVKDIVYPKVNWTKKSLLLDVAIVKVKEEQKRTHYIKLFDDKPRPFLRPGLKVHQVVTLVHPVDIKDHASGGYDFSVRLVHGPIVGFLGWEACYEIRTIESYSGCPLIQRDGGLVVIHRRSGSEYKATDRLEQLSTPPSFNVGVCGRAFLKAEFPIDMEPDTLLQELLELYGINLDRLVDQKILEYSDVVGESVCPLQAAFRTNIRTTATKILSDQSNH